MIEVATAIAERMRAECAEVNLPVFSPDDGVDPQRQMREATPPYVRLRLGPGSETNSRRQLAPILFVEAWGYGEYQADLAMRATLWLRGHRVRTHGEMFGATYTWNSRQIQDEGEGLTHIIDTYSVVASHALYR